MGKHLFQRFSEWLNGDPLVEEFVDEDGMGYEPQPASSRELAAYNAHQELAMTEDKKKGGNTLRLVNGPITSQIMIVEPENFQEVLYLIEPLRARKTIVLNLHQLDTVQSQRAVDFMAGATHAICGNQRQVADKVFIFTPSNVELCSPSSTKEAPQPEASGNPLDGLLSFGGNKLLAAAGR